ncbi:MAG TPA: TrkH family potassium uptake protein [Firmicutes bacterium]|nr:TrkH family potassium uptake protein [Bacillota bacterium]
MNIRTIAHVLGILLLFLSVTMLLPALIALLYQEPGAPPFYTAALLSALLGLILRHYGESAFFSHREAFAVVTFSWLSVAVLGGLPFYLGGSLPTIIDSTFEAMSGITTMGGTVYSAVEGIPHAYLFWRSFLNWIGGMGFIVLAIAVLPKLHVSSRLFQAEVPGPVNDRIQPRIKQTASVLWVIYAVMTLLLILLLRVGGMSAFDAINHALSAMGTGGFSTRNLSLESFQSPYVETVITIFMFLAGINFSLYFAYLRGRSWRTFRQSTEFKTYLGIIAAATLLITFNIWGSFAQSWWQALRLSGFQTVAIMTTTGFSTANYDLWPAFSRAILFILIFIGGCAGSTSGGMKVVRIVLCCKYIYRELIRQIHPRAVRYVTLDGRVVDEKVIHSVLGFMLIYVVVFIIGTLMLTVFNLDLVSAASSAAAALSNVGPGFGSVGPHGNYSFLPGAAKALLSLMMLIGRLEIYSVLTLFLPQLWRQRTQPRADL